MIFVKEIFAGWRQPTGRSAKSGVMALLNNIRIGIALRIRAALQDASAIGTRLIAHMRLSVGGQSFL
jgi:hypothetical protein